MHRRSRSSPSARARKFIWSTARTCCSRVPRTEPMPARLDPFVEVMLRERADQLYLLPDEPVTLVKDGKPRKVSKQPLTDQHIYALMVEVAPPEAADKIDQNSETEFDYAANQGLVRVRIVPESGRLTAVMSAVRPGPALSPPAPVHLRPHPPDAPDPSHPNRDPQPPMHPRFG